MDRKKTEGNGKMTPAEPLKDIHMPNNTIIPFIMTLGFFISGFGFIYQTENKLWYIALFGGMAIALLAMLVRSLQDDVGHYITKEELKGEAK